MTFKLYKSEGMISNGQVTYPIGPNSVWEKENGLVLDRDFEIRKVDKIGLEHDNGQLTAYPIPIPTASNEKEEKGDDPYLRIKQLESEVERLRGLIRTTHEKAYSNGYTCGQVDNSYYEEHCWQTFKLENNL